jgi:indole-3-glycerol phosphate synthase
MAMSLLGIAAHVAKRVQRLSAETPAGDLAERSLYIRTPRPVDFVAEWAELRFADPEKGFIVPKEKATAEEAARLAVESKATALAVWVERNFHAGDWEHLEAVRRALPDACLVARDFVVDPWQMVRARAAGADGVELMPAVLGPNLEAFAEGARKIGLTPVVFGEDGRPRPVGPDPRA